MVSSAQPLLRFTLHALRIGLPIGLVIGALLYALRGRYFWVGMAYAVGISVCISFAIAGLQKMACWGLQRHAPNLAPRDARLDADWPGWAWMLPCVLLGALGGHEVGTRLVATLLGRAHRPLLEGTARQVLLGAGFTLLVSLAVSLYFYSRERLQALELEQAALARLAAQAQLTALQAQLEPHMLFNTLAHLRALIDLRPSEAQAMLDDLIAYLRATLQGSRVPLHPLHAEFARLSDYLKLMQRRMGERLQVELDLPEALRDLPVPPLLLQPLVENAIQHGLEPQVTGGRLRVQARTLPGQRLELRVHDDGAGLHSTTARPGSGFGTRQVRERLQAQYGPHAQLELLAAQPGTLARIELPL